MAASCIGPVRIRNDLRDPGFQAVACRIKGDKAIIGYVHALVLLAVELNWAIGREKGAGKETVTARHAGRDSNACFLFQVKVAAKAGITCGIIFAGGYLVS